MAANVPNSRAPAATPIAARQPTDTREFQINPKYKSIRISDASNTAPPLTAASEPSLEDLPAKMRNMIYEMVLGADYCHTPSDSALPYKLPLSLLIMSRRIGTEAQLAFQSINNFIRISISNCADFARLVAAFSIQIADSNPARAQRFVHCAIDVHIDLSRMNNGPNAQNHTFIILARDLPAFCDATEMYYLGQLWQVSGDYVGLPTAGGDITLVPNANALWKVQTKFQINSPLMTVEKIKTLLHPFRNCVFPGQNIIFAVTNARTDAAQLANRLLNGLRPRMGPQSFSLAALAWHELSAVCNASVDFEDLRRNGHVAARATLMIFVQDACGPIQQSFQNAIALCTKAAKPLAFTQTISMDMLASIAKLRLRNGPDGVTKHVVAAVAHTLAPGYEQLLGGETYDLMARNASDDLVHGEHMLIGQTLRFLAAPLDEHLLQIPGHAQAELQRAVDVFTTMGQREPNRLDIQQDLAVLTLIQNNPQHLLTYTSGAITPYDLLEGLSLGQEWTGNNWNCKTSKAYHFEMPSRYSGLVDNGQPAT